jgi:molybdopterin synthase sulfur carrier subunit
VRALYFAWVRERIGLAEEELSPPAEVRTVAELMAWLAGRGETYAHAFENAAVIRTALDRTHVKHDAPLGAAREVAFFPPMTGG